MRERHDAFSLVKSATRGLVDRGAIERVRVGRAGQRAEFVLRFPDNAAAASSMPLRRTSSIPLWGTASDPHMGTRSMPPMRTPGTSEKRGE